MNGWELLECIKSSDELATIPVVMVTSLAALEHVRKAFALGASDFKVKPLCGPDVSALIGAVLAQQTSSEPAACSA